MEKTRNFLLLITLLATLIFSTTIGLSEAQQKTGSKTFYTIIFSGVENGEPQMKITSMTINGTSSELEKQLPQVADWLLNSTQGISPGPATFFLPNATEFYVTQPEPTKEQHLDYLESALEADGDLTDKPKCWIYWVGGGSMHGDCGPSDVLP